MGSPVRWLVSVVTLLILQVGLCLKNGSGWMYGGGRWASCVIWLIICCFSWLCSSWWSVLVIWVWVRCMWSLFWSVWSVFGVLGLGVGYGF